MTNSDKMTVWLNGEFSRLSNAGISPLDRGIQRGDGLFETIRVQKGNVLFLDDHLKRLIGSARILRINIPSYDWKSIIDELIEQNELSGSISRLKILITRGVVDEPGLPEANLPTIILICDKYSPPTQNQYEAGWKLHTFKTGYSPPLAMHKSLHYQFYMFARQHALDNNADDAIILDPEGYVSETTSTSIIYRKNGKYFTPQSQFQLPGITVQKIMEFLRQSNHDVMYKPTTIDGLISADSIFITSSLMGVMPINTVDEIPISVVDSTFAKILRNFLFNCSD